MRLDMQSNMHAIGRRNVYVANYEVCTCFHVPQILYDVLLHSISAFEF